MEKKQTRVKEKLFISEFSEDFFTGRCQSEEGLEDFIRGCADKVKERKEKGGIWHCILDVAVEEVCKDGLWRCFDFNKYFYGNRGRQKLMADFYGEPLFLKLDVAQAITYNLCRLGEKDEYDMEDSRDVEIWEEDFKDILDIGRKMPEKDMAVDLLPGLDRLKDRYNSVPERAGVYFPRLVNGCRITLERNFSGLNVLYIGNERFQSYLSRLGTKKAYLREMMGYIAALDKGNEPQQYAWEKMTGFNAINIIAKFLTEMAKKEGCTQRKLVSSFMKNIMEEYYYLFRQIMEMPNVLTRLLLLKQIFAYGSGMEDKMAWDYLRDVNRLLFGVNDRYKEIQECILEIAVYTRWMIGGRRDIGTWLEELEKEYPIRLFEEQLFSLNIGNGWYCNRVTTITKDRMEWAEERAFLFLELKKDASKIGGLTRYERKCRLLQDIKNLRYFDCRAELSQKLQEKKWFHIGSANLSENLRRQYERASVRTPLGKICTKTLAEAHEEGCEEFVDTVEELEKALRLCLLSEYKNVIFENTFMEEEKIYEEIKNYLFYHI